MEAISGISRNAGNRGSCIRHLVLVFSLWNAVTVMLGVIDGSRMVISSFRERDSELPDHHVKAGRWLDRVPGQGRQPRVAGAKRSGAP